jgi:hypothetical protein
MVLEARFKAVKERFPESFTVEDFARSSRCVMRGSVSSVSSSAAGNAPSRTTSQCDNLRDSAIELRTEQTERFRNHVPKPA